MHSASRMGQAAPYIKSGAHLGHLALGTTLVRLTRAEG
jgi:hypothetical protein